MPPLTDAMGFVDGKKRDTDAVEEPAETFGGQPFGRDVKQIEVPGLGPGPHSILFFR